MTGLGRTKMEPAAEPGSEQDATPQPSATGRVPTDNSSPLHLPHLHLPHAHWPHLHLPHLGLPHLGGAGEHRLLDALTHSLDMAGRGYCCASDPLEAGGADTPATKPVTMKADPTDRDAAVCSAAGTTAASLPTDAAGRESTGGPNAKLSRQ